MVEQPPSFHRSKQVHKLFSVMGWIAQGHAVELIIAKSESDAECYAIHELGFVKVDCTAMVSDHIHVGPADTKE
jgi:hypothetical protein